MRCVYCCTVSCKGASSALGGGHRHHLKNSSKLSATSYKESMIAILQRLQRWCIRAAPGLKRLRKNVYLFCALRCSSEGFALALRSHGTALTKSSPGCALAFGRAELFIFNSLAAPTARRGRLFDGCINNVL